MNRVETRPRRKLLRTGLLPDLLSPRSGVSVASEEETPIFPEAIDVHFHLDRTCRDLWGRRHGLSVEDLLSHPRAKGGT